MLAQHPKIAELLLIVYLGLLILGQLTRWQVFSSGALYAFDVVSILIVLIALPDVFQNTRQWWLRQNNQQQTMIKLTVTWIIFGWVVASIAGYELVPSLLRFGRLLLNLSTVWFLLFHIPHKSSNWWITVQIAIGVWLGWLQYVVLPDSRWLAVLGWDDHYFRLIGTFLDPNFMGLWLVLALIWWLHVPYKGRIKWLGMGIAAAALGVTFSRASFLAGTVALASMVAVTRVSTQRNLLQKILFIGCVVLATVVVAPKPGGEGVKLARTASVVARVDASQSWLPEQPYQWLWGRGLGVQQSVTATDRPNHSQMPDNLILLIFSGMGIGGILLCLAVLFSYRKSILVTPAWLLACWIAVLIHAQFNNSLLEPVIWNWLWVMTWSGSAIRRPRQ